MKALGMLFVAASLGMLGFGVYQGTQQVSLPPMEAVAKVTVEQAAPTCELGLSAIKEALVEQGLSYTEYTGDKLAAVVKGLIEVFGPPPTDDYASSDLLMAVEIPQASMVIVVFVKDNCFVGRGRIPEDLWDSVLQKAFPRS